MKYFIFCGRFQPFHNGHMQILKQAISELSSDSVLIVGIISPFCGDSVDLKFSEKCFEHLLPERNPWPVTIPLLAVSRIVQDFRQSGINNITITLLPDPVKSIYQLKKWIPDQRYWIIPKADESFDEDKVEFLQRHGEAVIRYQDTTGINGWRLRTDYHKDDYNSFSIGIPNEIVDIYWNNNEMK